MMFKEILKHKASVRHPAAYACKNKSDVVDFAYSRWSLRTSTCGTRHWKRKIWAMRSVMYASANIFMRPWLVMLN